MKNIFTNEYIEKLNNMQGKKVYVNISDNEVVIGLDWQSQFIVVKSESNGKIVYDFYYQERGTRTKYDKFSSERKLKKGLESYLRNFHY